MTARSTAPSPKADYRAQLLSELSRRKMSNPTYSLRAFARSLGVSAAFLSKLLRGQKDLSPETALTVAEKLGYNAQETADFCRLVQLAKATDPKLRSAILYGITGQEGASEYRSIDLESFQAISDWYHYAILELSNCPGRGGELGPERISRRLGITRDEAASALQRLIRLGLLKKARGRWVKSDAYLTASAQGPSRAIRNFHLGMIEKAKRSIESVPVELRDVSGSTFAIGLDKIEIARREIQAFRRKMTKLLDSSRPTEVYQLNVQFFPVSIPDPEGTER